MKHFQRNRYVFFTILTILTVALWSTPVIAQEVPPAVLDDALKNTLERAVFWTVFFLGAGAVSTAVVRHRAASQEKQPEKQPEEQLEQPPSALSLPAPILPIADDVHFTAFHARRADVDMPSSLQVYAHLESVLGSIQTDAQRYAPPQGNGIRVQERSGQTASLKAKTPITVVPEADGIAFTPLDLTSPWTSPWVRFDFGFQAPLKLVGSSVPVRISIRVGMIEIAHIDFSIEIIQSSSQPDTAMTQRAPKNRLRAAKETVTTTATTYKKVFISYSRNDKVVVDNYMWVQYAMGNEVFRDTEAIRAGENWQAALARAIDEADIFQLFWSENSANSDNVRDEWDYALTYRCPQNKCAEFILPCYWTDRLPAPPAELEHLNFKRVKFFQME